MNTTLLLLAHHFTCRGKQTILDLQCPRYLGKAITMGGIYVSVSNGQGSQLLCLKGTDGLPAVGYIENKENKYRFVVLCGLFSIEFMFCVLF